jgi:HSP20 family protein
MLSRRFSPWREMERMRREMNRTLSNVPSWASWNVEPTYPAMNVWGNEEGVVVTAELPGCDTEAIDISVVGNTLTVEGVRSEEEMPEDARYHRRERACGSFSRSFRLPFDVEAEDVEATFERGILTITLPRSEADKPKKISVKAG